jgi:UDP-N-acetylmuramyl pentapeptide phosphotransferase/UDP-N-acetylglucosamine-1-phosphate transferase
MVLVLLALGMWKAAQMDAPRVLAPVLAAIAVLALVSFIDDLRSLPASLRFGCHAIGSVLALASLGVGSWMGVAAVPGIGLMLGFVWLVGHTNAFNFMDGINGLAAGQACLTSLAMVAVALSGGVPSGHWAIGLAVAVAGVTAGFLPHNFPRARMFMGDVGSAPLGYLLGVLVLALADASEGRVLIPLVLLHSNFVLDTSITLLRRALRGEAWHKPHREHFYQRLIRAGYSHAYVTGLEMGLQLLVAAMAIYWTRMPAGWRAWVPALVVLLWTGFFVYAEREFRHGPRTLKE